MIGDDIVIIAKFFVADRTNARLLSNFAVQQFPHLRGRSQFPVSPRVMRIFNALNSESDQLWLGQKFASTTRERFVDRTQFIGTKSHGIPLIRV